jgi:succinoglycan biosynthesis transport protein ExoP
MYFGPALNRPQQYQLSSGLQPLPEQTSQADVVGILSTLLRRKRVFLAVFIGFLSIVILWTAVAPRQYTATTKLIAGASSGDAQRASDTNIPVLNALLQADSTMTAETYVDLIQQDPVVTQVIRNLRLPISRLDLLQNHIRVQPVSNTSIIQLSATWGDREAAVAIANEFAKVFVARERDLIAGQASSAIDYLTQQMPVAAAQMNKADDALSRFQAAHPDVYVTTGGEAQGSNSVVATTTQRYAQVKVDADQARAQLNDVLSQLNETSRTITGSSNVVQNPVTAQLQQQLTQVQVQLGAARKQYTEQHPAVQALEEQEAQLEKEIASAPATIVSGNAIVPNPVYQQLSQQASTLRAQIAGDQGQLSTLGIEMGKSSNLNNSLPAETNQLANLQRDATMAEDIYTALQQKYSDATVARTTALSDVSITQPATRSDISVKPDWLMNILLGIVLGLALATSAVFAVDFFDNTFKDEQDVQRALPLPVLTSVPQLNTGSPKKLPWLRALTVESFLQLVTALRYSSDKPLRTLAITSPHQGDGKTTVAMSAAIAMAELEPKVLLIDADLRRPMLHKRFDLAQGPGLSDVLVGQAEVSEAVQPTKYDGLYVLSGGTQVPNPVKLIHSPRLDTLLEALLKDYRAIIFDTPALLPVYDAAILSAKVDGAVLVISANSTDMPSTKKAMQRLSAVQGVNMLGVVLNRVTPANGYATYYLTADNPTPLPHENGVTLHST